ncbi:Pol [Symbiodinium necroappetens]|uniref:Pol protein n=1 Tax=Symbiodinium necroappetens TaxID=1628268 RepID=A0A812P8Y6_9DINO|nr:Pol [Symbiodinium necroappetens]
MDPEGKAEALREHRLQPRMTGTLFRMAILLVAGLQLGCTMATQPAVQKQNLGEPSGVGPRLGAHLRLRVPSYDHPPARDEGPLVIPRPTALHHCPAPSSWFLRKALKRQVIVARASRSFCKPARWTKLKPSCKGSMPISSVSFSRASPPAHELASWHGISEMWQQPIGTPCAPKPTNTYKAAGWCNGRTGKWLTPVGDDMQASPEREMAAFFWWKQTSVPWRPYLQRASQFQLYASRGVDAAPPARSCWLCQPQPSRKHLQDLSVKELHPGRLLQLQAARATEAARTQARAMLCDVQQQLEEHFPPAAAKDSRISADPRPAHTRRLAAAVEEQISAAERAVGALSVFSRRTADAELPPPLEHGLDLGIPLLQHKLSKVGIRKAVPPHIAPAAMWRLCSGPVGALLGPALNKHYSQGQVASAEGDWKNTNVIWLPKPHKKPITVASMRPIGLQSPATKSFASALKVAVMEHLQPVVRELPQYAYLPHRGTTDALLKVHQHFEQTAALIAANRIDRFQQKAGKQRSACVGGVSLSLDLSSAFDGVHRPTAYHTMLQHGVDRTTVNIIQSLHQQAQYHFTVGSCTDFVCTTNGIKQGCTIAPSIWAFFTVAVMLKLVEARSMEWLQQVCTLFADDCWGSWLIRTTSDVTRAIADIAHIIAVLEDFHLSVNYQKTAILLRLEGKQAAKTLADCTVEKEGNTYLEVDIRGVIRLIPIKSQHEYLGTTVSYHRRQDANTTKRMQAGQLRYQDIRRILNGRHDGLPQCSLCLRRFYRYPAKETAPAEPQQSTADTVSSVLCSFSFASQSPFAGMTDTDAQLTEDIFHACFPSGQTPLLQSPVDPTQSFPNKRPRPEFRSRARPGDRRGHPMYHSSPFQAPLPSSTGVSGDTFTQVCRLLLRHEEQLALIRQDRGLIVFVKQDQHSILPALYKASAAWNEKKEKAANLEAGLSLKTVLLSCVIRELLSRLQTVTSTEDGKAKLLAAGWINSEGHWVYQRWCAKTKRLIRDEDRTPLTHDNAVRLLTTLRDSLNGDIIHKFAATQPLYKLEEAGHQNATFFLEVSLRGKESDLVHALLLQLVNSSLTHLIGISVKRENGQRCKLAQQIAELAFRGLALTQNNLDWAATRLQNPENTILQLQADLRRQQKIMLDMLMRLQILEQKLLHHGRNSKCPENTHEDGRLQTPTHLEEMDE